MTDRLDQIWAGFSQRTSLDLSGTSVETTPRPSARYDEADVPVLDEPLVVTQHEEGRVDPVATALSALHTHLADKQGNRRRDRGQADYTPSLKVPESSVERTLLADMAFTESKTTRGAGSYIQYAADRQLSWQRRKKKWFFGLF